MKKKSSRAAGGRRGQRPRRPPAAGSQSPAPRSPSPSTAKTASSELIGEGLKLRLPAGFIDAAIVLIVMIALVQLAYWVPPVSSILRLVATLTPLIYFFLWESITQSTPGKRLLGLRVVTLDGGPPGLAEHLLRAATRVPEALIVLPFVLSISFSARNQRLGDSATETLVVRTRNL